MSKLSVGWFMWQPWSTLSMNIRECLFDINSLTGYDFCTLLVELGSHLPPRRAVGLSKSGSLVNRSIVADTWIFYCLRLSAQIGLRANSKRLRRNWCGAQALSSYVYFVWWFFFDWKRRFITVCGDFGEWEGYGLVKSSVWQEKGGSFEADGRAEAPITGGIGGTFF